MAEQSQKLLTGDEDQPVTNRNLQEMNKSFKEDMLAMTNSFNGDMPALRNDLRRIEGRSKAHAQRTNAGMEQLASEFNAFKISRSRPPTPLQPNITQQPISPLRNTAFPIPQEGYPEHLDISE